MHYAIWNIEMDHNYWEKITKAITRTMNVKLCDCRASLFYPLWLQWILRIRVCAIKRSVEIKAYKILMKRSNRKNPSASPLTYKCLHCAMVLSKSLFVFCYFIIHTEYLQGNKSNIADKCLLCHMWCGKSKNFEAGCSWCDSNLIKLHRIEILKC